MARSYARIDVRRGADPDWRALTLEQQAVYDFLLTHPKLSTCGALDVKLTTWRKLAAGVTLESLEALLDSLVDAGFIAWDRDTDEIVIRTFVRHDGVLQNRNLGKSMWSAWSALESDMLREYLVDHLPDLAFEPKFEPPISALRNRRSNGSRDAGSGHRSEGRSELPTPYPQPQLDPSSGGGFEGDWMDQASEPDPVVTNFHKKLAAAQSKYGADEA